MKQTKNVKAWIGEYFIFVIFMILVIVLTYQIHQQ